MLRSSRLVAGTVMLAVAAIVGCGPSPFAAPVGSLSDGSLSLRSTGYKAFFGIQHTHVAENGDDGQGTLAEAYTYARDKGKLDFLGISSHSHMINDAGYAKMKQAAKDFTQSGKFVALLAQEWSSISKGGHINIFEADERCPVPNGDWATFYTQWLPAHPEVAWAQFNHPHPSNQLEFGGASFSPVSPGPAAVSALHKFAGMALLNGPGKYEGEDMKGQPDDWDRGVNGLNYEEEYKEFLNRGWRIGAVGDQDNHVKNWGLASPTRTGIWAPSLTKQNVLEAFQARRTYATFDPNLQFWFSLDGQPMGSEIRAGKEITVEIQAADPDTAFARIELYGDTDGVGGRPATVISKVAVGKKAAKWTFKIPAPQAEGYYFAKLVYGDRTAWAWTSPVWVSR
jgi:hypothetical protein